MAPIKFIADVNLELSIKRQWMHFEHSLPVVLRQSSESQNRASDHYSPLLDYQKTIEK